MLWYKISATIGGSVASNRRKLSRKEFNGWAEYFSYEFDQHGKIELYLARILDVLYGLAGAEVPYGECFIPALDPDMVEEAQIEQKRKNALNAEDGAAALKGLFNNGN